MVVENAESMPVNQNERKTKSEIVGTAVVAVGVVVLLLCATAVVFVTFAALLRGDWIFMALGIVAFVLLYLLLSKLLRVAANQNKKPLG